MYVRSIDHSSEQSPILPTNPGAFNEKEVRKRLNDIACERIQAICADNKYRLENCHRDPQLLSKGVFYPHEYYVALNKTSQVDQIEALRKTDSFYQGFVSPEHYSIDVSLGSMMRNYCGSFLLKENVLPSEALKAVVEGPSLILCGVVCQIARWSAVQEVLGTEKFDALFASNSSTPFKIGLKSPISHLFKFEWARGIPFNTIKKGDLVHFPNHYLYPNKHKLGVAGAYNTICIHKKTPKFTSLGISGEGITTKEMNKLLIDEFNTPPNYALEFLAEETKKAVSKRFNFAAKEVVLHEGFESKFEICTRFDAEKITALANSTLQQARELLDQWSVKSK